MEKEYLDQVKKQLDKIKQIHCGLNHKLNRSVLSFSRFEINNEIHVLSNEVSQLDVYFQSFMDYIPISYNNEEHN
jgi:hypothetical protein